jgi:hypothetical protein
MRDQVVVEAPVATRKEGPNAIETRRAKKTMVFGMRECGGRVVRTWYPSSSRPRSATSRLECGQWRVCTNEAAAYLPLRAKGYWHRRINHAAKVYEIHPNTIEGFWR